jgi:hypothetical protein
MKPMSEDTKAILLLCGHLGSGCDFEPLSLGDYNQIVRWFLPITRRPDSPSETPWGGTN